MSSRAFGVEGVGTKKTYAVMVADAVANVIIADAATATAFVAAGAELIEIPVTAGSPGVGASRAAVEAVGTPVET